VINQKRNNHQCNNLLQQNQNNKTTINLCLVAALHQHSGRVIDKNWKSRKAVAEMYSQKKKNNPECHP